MCEWYIITIGRFIFAETRVVDKSDALQVQLTMTEAFLEIKLFLSLDIDVLELGI